MEEAAFLDYLEHAGRLTSPDNVPPAYRRELLRLMAGFVDSELAGAAGFAAMINRAPDLDGRRFMARMVLEKFGHGGQVLALMEPFGTDPERYVSLHPWDERLERATDLGAERHGGDMRLNVFYYPFEGWGDALAMNLLMGQASVIQLKELSHCSYQPLGEVIAGIAPVEKSHLEEGETRLARLLQSGGDRAELAASLDYWRPRVAASFGGDHSPRFEPLQRFGLRHTENRVLRTRWQQAVEQRLGRLGLA